MSDFCKVFDSEYGQILVILERDTIYLIMRVDGEIQTTSSEYEDEYEAQIIFNKMTNEFILKTTEVLH